MQKQRKNINPREMTKQDAEKMGINFSKGGPPRFKNDKKKEMVNEAPKEETRQVVDKSQA